MLLVWKHKTEISYYTVSSFSPTARQEVGRSRGAGAGVGVRGASMNVGETGRGNGVRKSLRGVEGGQRTRPRGGRPAKKKGKGRMSERVASCGSLYDSTNLLLQYCNNGEHISPRIIILLLLLLIAYPTKIPCKRIHSIKLNQMHQHYSVYIFHYIIWFLYYWKLRHFPHVIVLTSNVVEIQSNCQNQTVVYFTGDFSSKTDVSPLTLTQVIITNWVFC